MLVEIYLNLIVMSFSTLLLVFLLFLVFLVVSSFTDSDDCSGRWIYIRELPPRFNSDLLLPFSHHSVNHGFGPKTHISSESWYRTHPSMLELIFHSRITSDYPCLTPDPELADAVYLPYYAGLDAHRYLFGPDANRSAEHGLDLFQFLRRDFPSLWDHRSGHDHFLVMARPAWDFSQSLTNEPRTWGTSFLRLPQFYNVTAMVVESRPWAWTWQEQSIPHPTSFHPSNRAVFESWVQRVRRSPRPTLMAFVGGASVGSGPNIRRSILMECDNSTITTAMPDGVSKVCEFVNCSEGVCEDDSSRFMKSMLEARFCLEPPGDTLTRRFMFDAIVAGCIPVLFEEGLTKSQYGWHLGKEEEYGEFSVMIPKEEVLMENGIKIVDVLSAIPGDRVRRMRKKVIGLMNRVVYREPGPYFKWGGMKDAFDIAVEETLKRIKSRVALTN